MKHFKRVICFLLCAVLIFPLHVLAHPGDTDENGGHYDRSTGKYHYHHGYPAHQHPDGVCPYDPDYQARHKDVDVENIIGMVVILLFVGPRIFIWAKDMIQDHIIEPIKKKRNTNKP